MGCPEVQRFSRTVVKFIHGHFNFTLGDGRQVSVFREVLPDEPVGVLVQPSKTRATGNRLIFEWDDALRAAVNDIRKIKPRRIGDSHLFTTRHGKPYIDENSKCNAFDSLWQRFMDKVLAETRVTERFQERDLRAKVASDSASLAKPPNGWAMRPRRLQREFTGASRW